MAARLKLIETRATPVLDAFIGRRVGVIRTGGRHAVLVGWVTISGRKLYTNAAAFHADDDLHQVRAGSMYDIKPGRVKYGYVLSDYVAADPVEVPASTSSWDRSARDISIMFQ